MRVSNVTVRKRLISILVIGLLVFFVVDVRLGYVQLIKGKWLSERAEDLWSRNIVFEPERGRILDRNDEPLAINVSAPSVIVVPRQIQDPAQVAKSLAEILGMDEKKAYEHVTKSVSNERIHPEGRKISNEKANEIRALNLPGVYIAEDSKRYYPNGEYLSHVLGFTGIDNQGLTGLELFYEERLKGEKGHVSFTSDGKGRRMPDAADQYIPPTDGLDLRLTVDTRVQTIVERELDNAEAMYNPDGIIAIAMNPKSGEILAMSSRPDFHPNEYQDVPSEIYNRNLPIWSTYEPGSTFKIITLAAALEEKVVNLEEDHFHDPGFIKVAGATLKCWKRGGHGSQTYLEVVQNSCNPGFVALGEKLGKDKLFKYVKDFGFGQKTGVDIQGEGRGILFEMDRVGPVELATTAFGQGISVTPIQQVAAVSAAVNGGYLYQPYIAKEWVDPITGKVVERKEPVLKRRVISEETSKEIRHALESVVALGTGKNAFVEGYRVGGKTGTAQKVEDGRYLKNNFIVSFIGVAPADDPQLIVYIAVDNPKGTVQFGGTVAAPIVGQIMEDSLRALKIPPRNGQIEKERAWNDAELVEVPNFVSLTREEAQSYLLNLKVQGSGKGDIIIDQAPKAGVKLEAGSTIRLYFGEK
ncbi:stage V sporulation protein D [Bacillus solimangrovi]|uniref:serine-type D-Ala-D-Ala carboxypeptidase n=1 Tax=Bacillus solimangrovi TaxID=1305675 RepID=A0A1E5LIR6_9BACI|nr:stage V sporulation protein D [Bacillus solimangrovi]OEH93946.1 stage V sporulation protein D [Bacillus solimangrovi]